MLLPIGAIEEHNSHLPLGTDAMNATAQVFHVRDYLRKTGFETIIGPPLNIGITNEASDRARDGTYALPQTTHADGAETSWTVYFYRDGVRPGYRRFPQSPSSRFMEVLRSGDRTKNPSGSGGFPFENASAAVGKKIVDFRTARIA